MEDFCHSETMRKKRGKVDKPNTDNGFSNDISSFFSKDFLRMINFDEFFLK